MRFVQIKDDAVAGLRFINADGRSLPFGREVFDYVFVKDVLHHVGDQGEVLREILRVSKKDAGILILEANRYNPVGYIHMTLGAGHDHFSQSFFRSLIARHFEGCDVRFDSFNAHVVPVKSRRLRSMFYYVVDLMGYVDVGRKFLSYNLARIRRLR